MHEGEGGWFCCFVHASVLVFMCACVFVIVCTCVCAHVFVFVFVCVCVCSHLGCLRLSGTPVFFQPFVVSMAAPEPRAESVAEPAESVAEPAPEMEPAAVPAAEAEPEGETNKYWYWYLEVRTEFDRIERARSERSRYGPRGTSTSTCSIAQDCPGAAPWGWSGSTAARGGRSSGATCRRP